MNVRRSGCVCVNESWANECERTPCTGWNCGWTGIGVLGTSVAVKHNDGHDTDETTSNDCCTDWRYGNCCCCINESLESLICKPWNFVCFDLEFTN